MFYKDENGNTFMRMKRAPNFKEQVESWGKTMNYNKALNYAIKQQEEFDMQNQIFELELHMQDGTMILAEWQTNVTDFMTQLWREFKKSEHLKPVDEITWNHLDEKKIRKILVNLDHVQAIRIFGQREEVLGHMKKMEL